MTTTLKKVKGERKISTENHTTSHKEIREWVVTKAIDMAVFSEVEFKLKGNFADALKVVVSFDIRRVRSLGGLDYGRPYMSLALAKELQHVRQDGCVVKPYEPWGDHCYHEYGHIADDPEIGRIRQGCHWQRLVMTIIAHEMAHVVDLFSFRTAQPLTHRIVEGDSSEVGTHGPKWQAIYRILRCEFANSAKPDDSMVLQKFVNKNRNVWFASRQFAIDCGTMTQFMCRASEKFIGSIYRKNGVYVAFPGYQMETGTRFKNHYSARDYLFREFKKGG